MAKPDERFRTANAPATGTGVNVLIAAVIAVVVGGVFAPALSCGFIDLDDHEYVLDNPLVKGGLTPSGCQRAWTEVVFFARAPLTVMSLQMDVTLGGVGARVFHLTNVGLRHGDRAQRACA